MSALALSAWVSHKEPVLNLQISRPISNLQNNPMMQKKRDLLIFGLYEGPKIDELANQLQPVAVY